MVSRHNGSQTLNAGLRAWAAAAVKVAYFVRFSILVQQCVVDDHVFAPPRRYVGGENTTINDTLLNEYTNPHRIPQNKKLRILKESHRDTTSSLQIRSIFLTDLCCLQMLM